MTFILNDFTLFAGFTKGRGALEVDGCTVGLDHDSWDCGASGACVGELPQTANDPLFPILVVRNFPSSNGQKLSRLKSSSR